VSQGCRQILHLLKLLWSRPNVGIKCEVLKGKNDESKDWLKLFINFINNQGIMRFMRTRKIHKNTRVLSKMIGAIRYSAKTQKLEGWWQKMRWVAKCQSDSLAKCQCSTGFDEGVEKWILDFSPKNWCGILVWHEDDTLAMVKRELAESSDQY
jgi:hypothetical protein